MTKVDLFAHLMHEENIASNCLLRPNGWVVEKMMMNARLIPLQSIERM